MTEPERRPDRPDDLRFPDPRPLRRLQLATATLIVVAAVITLTSGSRPAEVRWGAVIGLAVLILVVLWATWRRRGRRAPSPGQNTRNTGEK